MGVLRVNRLSLNSPGCWIRGLKALIMLIACWCAFGQDASAFPPDDFRDALARAVIRCPPKTDKSEDRRRVAQFGCAWAEVNGRFYLSLTDEVITGRIAESLRAEGFDVIADFQHPFRKMGRLADDGTVYDWTCVEPQIIWDNVNGRSSSPIVVNADGTVALADVQWLGRRNHPLISEDQSSIFVDGVGINVCRMPSCGTCGPRVSHIDQIIQTCQRVDVDPDSLELVGPGAPRRPHAFAGHLEVTAHRPSSQARTDCPDSGAGNLRLSGPGRPSTLRRAAGGTAGFLGVLAWFGVESASAGDWLGAGASAEDIFELEAALSNISGGPNKYEMMIERDLDKHVDPGTAALIRFSHRNRW